MPGLGQPLPEVDPAEQHREGLGLQPKLAPALDASRPAEAPFLKPLGQNPEPGPVAEEDLQAVEPLVGEDEQPAIERVLLQMPGGHRVKPVEALAHVHRLNRQVDPLRRGETQHALSSRISPATSPHPKPPPISQRAPLGR